MQPDAENAASGPKGLRGWLILPLIGLVIYPFSIGFTLVREFMPIFRDGHWSRLTTAGAESYHPAWAPLIIASLGVNFLLIAFALALLALAFMKSSAFPKLYITLIVVNFLVVSLDAAIPRLIPSLGIELDEAAFREVVRTAAAGIIWGWYFLVSKRVKNTFVN